MKSFLPFALGLACLVLIISLVVTMNRAAVRQEADAAAIADSSNQVVAAQSQIATRAAALLACSNRLDEAQAAVLTFSNHLAEAQAALALAGEQVTNLTRQMAAAQADNLALTRGAAGLTNQVSALTRQLAVTTASLTQTNQDLVRLSQDYLLLNNRFRTDVAERVVIERQFNNPAALQAQLQNLKKHPAQTVTPESIYSGLNVEVKSNGWARVITPD